MSSQEEKTIDYYSLCVPYNQVDVNLISTRFPYSKERMEAVLANARSDGSLSSSSIPVWFVKPVSLLEEWSHVLDHFDMLVNSKFESKTEDKRLLVVLKYILATCSTFQTSVRFPCIPFLGETFSCFVNSGTRRISYLAEQCSLHPHTTAFHVEDDEKEFQLDGCVQPKYIVCGSSIRCMWRGSITLTHRCGDSYTFSLPSILYTSLFTGDPERQLCGKCDLKACHHNNLVATLEFVERSFLGSDSQCVRVIIFKDNNIDVRIQGRWDIGYELFREQSQTVEEFLAIRQLTTCRRYVLRDALQGPMESRQLWKSLRENMIGGSDYEVTRKILNKAELKKKHYQKMMEQLPEYRTDKRILFETEGDPLSYRLKPREDESRCFLDLSRNAPSTIVTVRDIHEFLEK